MKRWLTMILVLLSVTAQASDWVLHDSRDGISIYNATIPGQQLRAFRGVVTVDAPIKSVLALLSDTGNMPNWFYQMRAARDLKIANGADHYLYFVIAGIWPVSDRDAVVKVTPAVQAGGTIAITIQGQPDRFPRQDGFVRIPRLESSWVVRPVSADKTEVTLTTSSDPGGALPRWVANLVATDMPRHTLGALRREIRKPAYAHVDERGSPEVRERLARYRL